MCCFYIEQLRCFKHCHWLKKCVVQSLLTRNQGSILFMWLSLLHSGYMYMNIQALEQKHKADVNRLSYFFSQNGDKRSHKTLCSWSWAKASLALPCLDRVRCDLLWELCLGEATGHPQQTKVAHSNSAGEDQEVLGWFLSVGYWGKGSSWATVGGSTLERISNMDF